MIEGMRKTNNMSSDKPSPPTGQTDKSPTSPARNDEGHDPDWAAGLKQLYDAVVDEDLPDTFKELLAKLDEDDGDQCFASDDNGGQS